MGIGTHAMDRIILTLSALLVLCQLSSMEGFLSECFVDDTRFSLKPSASVMMDPTVQSRWAAKRHERHELSHMR